MATEAVAYLDKINSDGSLANTLHQKLRYYQLFLIALLAEIMGENLYVANSYSVSVLFGVSTDGPDDAPCHRPAKGLGATASACK